MKSKIFKLAVLPAIIVAVIAYLFTTTQTSTSEILIAKRNLPAGTTITKNDLTTMKIPTALVPGGAIKDPKLVVGKRLLVARVAGDLILESALADKNITLGPNEVLFYLNIPRSLEAYVSQGTNLIVVTLPTGNVPSQVFDNLPVVAIVSAGSDETGSGSGKIAIVKAPRDVGVALSQFIKNGAYSVMIQK